MDRPSPSTSVSATARRSPRLSRPSSACGRGRWARAAIFDDAGLDVAVLDHHGVVEHGHVGHAAVAVPGIEIGAEHRILLGGRHGDAHLAGDVVVALDDAAHAAGRAEIVGDDAHRNAGAAALASRPVGDRLAAAEAAVGEDVVELAGALADQVGEYLALLLAAEIGARRRSGQVELRRVTRVLGHGAVRRCVAAGYESGRRLGSPDSARTSKAKSGP